MSTCSIGVTGHRVLEDPGGVRIGVEAGLDRIRERWHGASFEVVSPLAEGVDRLVAEAAMTRLGARLVVPLPLPRPEYVRDFRTAESHTEFEQLLARAAQVIELPPAASRTAAYEAAGRFVLERCTVLLAVWDGREARGRGGTAHIVEIARERRKPLVWVRAGQSQGGSMTTENCDLR